jgi:predicted DNA-binding transcriptional regulator AlpA
LTIPIEQQSPYPGQRATDTPSVPESQTGTPANSARGPPRLMDRAMTLEFFGGIDVSTLYRGVRSGRYPRPINVSDNIVRWLADECQAALDRMISDRDKPKPKSTKPRGRKRRRVA